MKSFLTAGLALAACAALAGVEKQTFDGSTTLPTGFEGDGTIELKTEGVTDNKVLAVDGTVTCANSAGDASQWGKTTFLVKAPEDATAPADLPTAADIGGCQIAVATGAEATDTTKLKVMVYQGGTTPAWVEAQNVTVAKGAWFTVVLDFDYSVSKVQVLVNGTSAGWFPLVTTQATTSKIASLSFVGSTKVDDVSIAEVDNVPAEALPADLQKLNVNLATLGVSIEDINCSTPVGNSGLTVAQKIESGLNPKDDSTFTATALAPAADGKLAITVPCAFDNGQAYEVYVNDVKVDSTKAIVKDGNDKITGVNLTFAPGDAKVLKVQVKAVAPSAQ